MKLSTDWRRTETWVWEKMRCLFGFFIHIPSFIPYSIRHLQITAYIISEIDQPDYPFDAPLVDRSQSCYLHRVYHKAKYMFYPSPRPRLPSIPFLLSFGERMISIALFVDPTFYLSLSQYFFDLFAAVSGVCINRLPAIAVVQQLLYFL